MFTLSFFSFGTIWYSLVLLVKKNEIQLCCLKLIHGSLLINVYICLTTCFNVTINTEQNCVEFSSNISNFSNFIKCEFRLSHGKIREVLLLSQM